jgi:hypothetical protein
MMPQRLKLRLLAIAGMMIAGIVAMICGAAAQRLGIDEQTATLVMTISFFLVVVIGALAYERSWFS